MSRAISEVEHLATLWGVELVAIDRAKRRYVFERFAKPTETQAQAIKRLMAQLKRRRREPETASFFPAFRPGMTTARYVDLYLGTGHPFRKSIAAPKRPAPYHPLGE